MFQNGDIVAIAHLCPLKKKRNAAPLFQQLILDANVLDIAMRYREDVLVLNNVRNNENFRHAAWDSMSYGSIVIWEEATGELYPVVM